MKVTGIVRPVVDNMDTVGALLFRGDGFGETHGMVVVHKDEKKTARRGESLG